MQLVPNSWGTDLRESNDCHEPGGQSTGGQFCASSSNRSVYGATEDDPETLTPKMAEADELDQNLRSYEDRGVLKHGIAEALETAWDGHEEAFEKLVGDAEGEVAAHLNEIGEEGSGGEVEVDDDHHQEYDQYEEDERQSIDEDYQNAQRDDWSNEKDKYIENVHERETELQNVWEQELRAIDSPYGDLDPAQNPTLRDVVSDATPPPNPPTEENLAAMVNARVHFERGENVVDPMEVFHQFDVNPEHDSIDDSAKDAGSTDDEMRAFIREKIRAGYTLGEVSDEAAVEGHEYFGHDKNGDDYEQYDRWFEAQGGYESADYSSIKSYEDWATEQGYTHTVGGGIEGSNYSREKAVASFLIHKWADTSGDSDKIAIAMQLAAAAKWNIPNAYLERMQSDSNNKFQRGESFYKEHAEALDAFLGAMYENTQEKLFSGEGGYVTLYRGFTLKGASSEPGVETVDFEHGSLVDVNLQPMSSFSTRFSTAKGFTGHGDYRAEIPVVMAMRVPKSAIVGSFRSGFGAANEYEVVVAGRAAAGGRYERQRGGGQHGDRLGAARSEVRQTRPDAPARRAPVINLTLALLYGRIDTWPTAHSSTRTGT